MTQSVYLQQVVPVPMLHYVPLIRVPPLSYFPVEAHGSLIHMASSIPAQPKHSGKNILCYWPRPPQGFVAVNCDASYQPSKNLAGLGVLIRDIGGNVVMCKSKREREVHDRKFHQIMVLQLELSAVLEGILLAKALGFPYIQVQSDSKNAIDIIIGASNIPNKCVDIVRNIEREATFFKYVLFTHVYRESNAAADYLSKYLSHEGETCMDCYDLPEGLKKIVMKDAGGFLYQREKSRSLAAA